MEIDEIAKAIKEHAGKQMTLGYWELHAFDKAEGAKLSVKAVYEIVGVVRIGQRIKVLVKIEIFDCWELFKENAQRAVSEIVKGQISNLIQGIDDSLDVTIVED